MAISKAWFKHWFNKLSLSFHSGMERLFSIQSIPNRSNQVLPYVLWFEYPVSLKNVEHYESKFLVVLVCCRVLERLTQKSGYCFCFLCCLYLIYFYSCCFWSWTLRSVKLQISLSWCFNMVEKCPMIVRGYCEGAKTNFMLMVLTMWFYRLSSELFWQISGAYAPLTLSTGLICV